jgi:hypothetical protein
MTVITVKSVRGRQSEDHNHNTIPSGLTGFPLIIDKGHKDRIGNSDCFPRQQWLDDSASVLRYKHIACVDIKQKAYIKWHFTTESS